MPPPLRTPEPLRAMPEPEPVPARAPEPQPAERPFDRPRPAVPPRPPRPAAPFPSEEPARQGGFFGLLAAFIPFGVATLLVGGLIYGVMHFRSEITARVPVLGRFYEVIGLGPAVTDLSLQNVTYGRTFEDGVPILEVRGEVVNKGPRTIELPRIQAVLRDKDGTVLSRWTFAVAPSKPQITGKETVGFVSRYPSPPPHAVSLALSFAAHGAN
jgi:hypothetical protein